MFKPLKAQAATIPSGSGPGSDEPTEAEISFSSGLLLVACVSLSVSLMWAKETIDRPCLIFTDGRLEVFQHNKLLTSISVWTTFGELAILYNCTRTASVRGKGFYVSMLKSESLIDWFFFVFWTEATSMHTERSRD